MTIFQHPFRLLILVPIIGILLASCSSPQTPPSSKEKIPQSIGDTDTSSRLKFTSGIRSILEDSHGNIWFGSHQEGLAKYDGVQFTYFWQKHGLDDSQVRNIYEDKEGKIWFETGKKASFYDGKLLTTPLYRNYYKLLDWKIDGQSLWFKGDLGNGYNSSEKFPGVYKYDGTEFSYHSFPITPKENEQNYFSVTTPFIRGKNNRLWFGTYGAVIGFDGHNFTLINNDFLDLSSEDGSLHIRAILEDSEGNLWIGNNGIGVFKFDGEKAFNFTKKHRLNKEQTKGNSLDRIFSIQEDDDGNMWFGTVYSGLWKFDGNTFTNFTGKDGLPSEQIWTIYKSKSGELWFGTASPSGVYRLNGKVFERIF
ncbi:MAG: hypothetical protein MRZ79_13825 [Bacteroidia bacterium]|nr:hypothetical protein [Bacteroidia bacterium]